MHFLQAAILSIAALAFTASASAVVSQSCTKCYYNSDCINESGVCQGASPGVVSNLLLPVCSKLTCNYFTEVWVLLKFSPSMVKELSFKWNGNQGERRRYQSFRADIV